MSDLTSQASVTSPAADEPQPEPKWQPLGRIERRVLGVLVEKAKTTPDAYPMTLNALTSGANQKSNRDPQMSLEPDQVEESLEKLRQQNAVTLIQGVGRVDKYRHLVYEWMGVDKVEAAVMAELLLRGPQTLGELRGRAARMEPIADVAALRPIVNSLMEKGLVVALTPEGRGQIVTHALYPPQEMEKVRQNVAGAASVAKGAPVARSAPAATAGRASDTPISSPPPSTGATQSEIEQLRRELHEVKSELDRLKAEVSDLWANVR